MLSRLAVVFAVAVLVNYAWELAQAPLYTGMDELTVTLQHCFIAALGDGLLVLAIFAVGAVALHRSDWFMRPGVAGYAVMLVAGLAIGVAVEWWGLHLARRWDYSELMPRLPGLGIGAAPVAQMLVLPPLIFRIAVTLLERWARPH